MSAFCLSKLMAICDSRSGSPKERLYGPLRRDRRRRLEELRTGDGHPLPSHSKLKSAVSSIGLNCYWRCKRDALLAAHKVTAGAPAAMLLDIKGSGNLSLSRTGIRWMLAKGSRCRFYS